MEPLSTPCAPDRLPNRAPDAPRHRQGLTLTVSSIFHYRTVPATWLIRALTLGLLAVTLPLAARGLYGLQGAWVHVRWQPSVDAAERQRLETEWQFVEGQEVSPATWRYHLTAPSADRLRAIVEHAAVADTHYIDRQRYTLTPETLRTARRHGLITVGSTVAVGLVDRLATLLAVLVGLFALVRFSAPGTDDSAMHDAGVRLHGRAFVLALVGVSTLVVTAWLVSPPRYLTNDDATIRLALEGRLVPSQPPTGFVLHAHSALGWALATLYDLSVAVPWWDIVLAGTLFWALAVFVALAWSALGAGWCARTTALGAVCIGGLPLIATMQFTFTATVAGAAAALLAGTESMTLARPRRSMFVMAALLLIVGLLVRPMAALAGALTTTLLLIPAAALSGSSGRLRVQRLAGVLLIAVSGCAALLYCDGLLYGRSADWNEYYQYNWMIVRLFEWGGELSEEQVDAIRASVGWSANDWNLLRGMWGVDPGMYGVTRVAAAYETIVGETGWRDWIEWLTARFTVVDGAALARLGPSTAVLVLVGGVLAGAYGGRRSWVASGLVVGLFLVVCVGIEMVFKELPLRLLAPLACGFLVALLVTVGSLPRPPTSPVPVVLCLGVVLVILAYEGRAVATALAADRRHSLQVDGEVERFLRLKPSLVVLHSDTFPAEHWWRPFHQPAVPMSTTIRLGPNNQNPQLQRFLSNTARRPLLSVLCEDPSILVVAEMGRLEAVTTYFREHENAQVSWDEVYAGVFRAWRCAGLTPLTP